MNLDKLRDYEKKVYEILFMPIVPVNRKNEKPFINSENIIETGEIYIPENSRSLGCLDADMSDIAILFYETIYSVMILKEYRKALFDKNVARKSDIRRPNNSNFLGDTMITSFKKEIPNYHCLANFWILPGKIGRELTHNLSRGRKNSLNDKMDLFLKDLKKKECEYKEEFPQYFKEFDLEPNKTFYSKHFLYNSFIDKNGEIISIDSVDDAKNAISKRAYEIAKAKGEELYSLFDELKFINLKKI